MLTRRLAIVTAGSLLAYGCAGPAPTPNPAPPSPTPTPLPQNVLDDITAILTGFENMLPGIVGLLSSDVVAKITTWVGTLQDIVRQISAANGTGSVANLISAFVSTAQEILGALGVNLPSWLGAVVSAAQFLLPIILAAVGVGSRARADAAPGDEAQARTILISTRPPFAARGSRLRRR